jgi:thiamine pyrophosphate-dependent acetolactate synthase large subunit-like protein
MGPVFVSLPVDDMAVELDDTQLSDINVVRARQVTHATAFPDHMAKEIARRLAEAEAPLSSFDLQRRSSRLIARSRVRPCRASSQPPL